MPLPIRPGPFPGMTAEMAYVPRTPPAFPGDIQHDFRDHLADRWQETLADWVGEASHIYLRAAGILRRRHIDPLAVSLDLDPIFDARTLLVAHDHIAACWRHLFMPAVFAAKPHTFWGDEKLYCVVRSYNELTAIFRQWLRYQANQWANHRPDILELFLLAVVGEHTRSGQSIEAELYYTFVDLYPVPGVVAPKPLPIDPA